ncbi:hypothetical protein PCC9214_00875 [Planktothrix tepida]|uniref:Uncharacterized protein n=2 Tax=Planktothrix TaxID=54304 RepID=A0A1J1LEH6_9CYAN|nr:MULTISPECIES: ribbon-helix-helix protein, CopG family [Planktothrix]CAD5924457.1 hypothetical protein PCC9214_00875 [Planktothrix tepida]CAD5981865.1 hypothetical protein NO713_04894 [Planktothrix pseudagardhii]CUR30394.1 conserved hypothetical protein [Planktothrix tepida PCC 9214]
MPNPFLGVRIPSELHEALMARVETTGQSKSDIVIQALSAYLGIATQHQKLENLETRLSTLELKLEQLTHRIEN